MLKLLKTDLILNWRILAWTYALWSALWLGMPIMSSSGDLTFGMWTGMVSVACAFLPITMLGREDKFKAGALLCSLPVTRSAIVASRYVGGWLWALGGVALAIVVMGMLWLAGVRTLLPPTPMLPVVVVAIVGTTIALMMPLPLRFGIAGVIGFLVATQLLGVVVLLASALFDRQGIQLIESAVRAVVDAVRVFHRTQGPVVFSLAVLAIVLALNVASYRLSTWIYRRRDF